MTAVSKYAPTEDEMEFARASMPMLQSKKTASTSKYAATPEEMEFAQAAMAEPIKEELPWYKSIPAAAAKGLSKFGLRAAENIRKDISPEGLESDISSYFLKPEEKKEIQKVTTPYSEEEKEKFSEELQKRLPSNEGLIEDIAEKGSELLPTALFGKGSLVSKGVRTGLAATAGSLAKQAGAGKGTQTLIEMAAFASPSLSKKLVGKNPKEQQLIDFARSMGLIEEEIVPGLKKENNWRKFLAKFASTGKKTQERVNQSKSAIGNIYNSLKESPEASNKMGKEYLVPMMNEFQFAFKDTAPSIRKKILPSFIDLMKSKGRGEDFIRFYQHAYEDAGQYAKKIGKIQNVTKKAIKQISPELGKEFELTNELYSNMSKLRERLAPPSIDIAKVTKGVATIHGLFTGDFTALKHVLKYIGAQKIASELLLNPRYQNLLMKTGDAIKQGKIHLAKQSFKEFKNQFSESYPEFQEEVSEEDFNDYLDKYYASKK